MEIAASSGVEQQQASLLQSQGAGESHAAVNFLNYSSLTAASARLAHSYQTTGSPQGLFGCDAPR